MNGYLGPNGDVVQKHLSTDADLRQFHYVGDFDQDGDVDIVASAAKLSDMNIGGLYQDFTLLVNRGDGTFDSLSWPPDVSVLREIRFQHLNGDEYLDAVFVDSDQRYPAVVVYLGGPDGLLVQEGRYPLEGYGGQVLSGDVNNDTYGGIVNSCGRGPGDFFWMRALGWRPPGLPVSFTQRP